jgi:WD40 repeat protein
VTATTLADGTQILVSGGDDATIRLWRLDTGEPLGEPLVGHEAGVNVVVVAALRDGTPVLVSGSVDTTIRRWDLAGRAPLGEPLTGHTKWVNTIAVTRPGAPGAPLLLVSGSDDATIRLWRLDTGEPLGEPLDMRAKVLAIAGAGDLLAVGTAHGIAACRLTPPAPD